MVSFGEKTNDINRLAGVVHVLSVSFGAVRIMHIMLNCLWITFSIAIKRLALDI